MTRIILLLIFVSCSLFSCVNKERVVGIELDKTELILRVGQSDTLYAYVVSDGEDNVDIIWNSEDESVAIVDILSGKVTAISEGSTTITASSEDGQFTGECAVVVKRPVSVYAIGNSTAGGILWRDGKKERILHDYSGNAKSICLHNDDIYISGERWIGGRWEAYLWNEGSVSEFAHLGFPTFVSDLYVADDGTVLACGRGANELSTVPLLWTNGSSSELTYEKRSEAQAVLEHDGVVYVAGFDDHPVNVGYYDYGVVWTDGARETFTDAKAGVTCTGMEVGPDGKIYICGYMVTDAGFTIFPFVYVDGEMTYLPYEGLTFATDICIDGDDIYVCGYQDVTIHDEVLGSLRRGKALYWKNGELCFLTDGTTDARASAIEVRDSDIYVGGRDAFSGPYCAVIWKNDEIYFVDDSEMCEISGLALTE